jgi:hypothetical protein
VVAVLVFVVVLAVIGLGYLALIKGQTIAVRMHFPFITIETRQPDKPELPSGDKTPRRSRYESPSELSMARASHTCAEPTRTTRGANKFE